MNFHFGKIEAGVIVPIPLVKHNKSPGHNIQNTCEKSLEGTEKADGPQDSRNSTAGSLWVLGLPHELNRMLEKLATWKYPYT